MGELTALGPIINLLGIAGVLAFVLLQINPRLDRVEAALNRMARAQMLTLLGSEHADDSLKRQAKFGLF